MKRLLLFSLFTSLLGPQVGFTQDDSEIKDINSCSGLSLSLGEIERKLMSSKKSGCTSNCQSLGDATSKYNEAVAKLVILEGLIALNAGITESADAIKNITPSKIEKVKDLSEEFIESFEKAKVLNKVLEIQEDDKYALRGYAGEKTAELYEHLKTSAPEIYKELEGSSNKNEILESLQGFHEADKQVTSLGKREAYENYQKYLNFEVDGKKIDMNDPTSHTIYQDVLAINQLTQKNKLSDEEKKELLAKSNSLQTIHVQLNKNSNIEKNLATAKIDEEIGVYLQNNQSMSANLLLDSDRQKEKLLGLRKQLEHTEKAKINGLKDELLGMSKICSEGEDAKACLIRMEGTPEYASRGLSKFKPLLQEKRTESPTEALLSALSTCYDQKELARIKECQMMVMNKNTELTKTEITEARDNLVKAKEEMDKLYQDEEIKKLQNKKAELYAKLQQDPDCKEGTEISKIDLSNGFCGFKELNGLIMSSGTTGSFQNIITAVERTYQADIRAQVNQELSDSNYASNDHGADERYRSVASSVSYGTFDNTVTRDDVKAEKRKIKELKKQNRTGPSGAEYALQGLAQVTVTSAPQLMMLHQENMYVKSYAENYRQTMIQRQQYQSWVTQQQKYYGQLYATGNMNYGWGFYNPNFASNFNYPNNQYTFYQHGSNGFNFSQYNFLNPTLTPTNGTGTTTTNPQFNFQF